MTSEKIVLAALESIPHGISFDDYWKEVCRRCDQLPIEHVRAYLAGIAPRLDLSHPYERGYVRMIQRYGDDTLKALLHQQEIVVIMPKDLHQVGKDDRGNALFSLPPKDKRLTLKEALREIFCDQTR